MRMMKKPQAAWRLLPAAIVLLPVGCSSMSNTDKGLLGGAALGGVAGGLIGHACHNTGAGVAIGALAGGLTGAAVGNDIDHKEHQKAVAQANADYAAAHPPLTLEQISDLTHQGVGDAVIIEQIRLSRATYALTAEHLAWLHQAGVHDAVIFEMQQSGGGRVVFAPPPVVFVDGPPPPPRVGVGFTYVGGRRW
jgi:hypothetical protein